MADSPWSILICTYRRPALLADLLNSVRREQAVAGAPSCAVVVVDNDVAKSAATVVAQAQSHGLKIAYHVEPIANISLARNLAVASATTEVALFLDDDQVLPPGSLAVLKKIWEAVGSRADALSLKKVARADAPLSPWLGVGKDLGTTDAEHLEDLPRGAMGTGGFLFRRSAFLGRGLAFDAKYGERGGEDVDLYLRAKAAGVRFLFCSEPFVVERLPAERATLSYALKSAERKGATDARLATRMRGGAHVLNEGAKAGLFLLAALALLIPAAVSGRARLGHALVVCARQWGKLGALIAMKRRWYEKVSPRPVLMHLTGGGQDGGAERLLEQMSRHAGRDPAEVIFFFYDWRGDLAFIRDIEARGFTVVRHQKRPGVDWGLWRTLAKTVATRRVGVIHTHDLGAMLHASVMRLLSPSLRLVHTEHTIHYWIGVSRYRVLYRLLSGLYQHVACVSDFVQSELRQKVGASLRRLTIVPNGVDLTWFRRDEVQNATVGGKLRLASVGRVDANKNLREVLEAMGRLCAKGYDVTLDHAGTGDLALVHELKALVADLGLSSSVRFHGFREDVRPLLANADAFISASRVECHPISVLEAMAFELPCLLSDIPPHADLKSMGNRLFSLDDGSIDEAILAALADSCGAELRLAGQAARVNAARYFSLEVMMSRYAKLYV